MNFDHMIRKILEHEGGYINHPHDPGGETNFGISKKQYPHLSIRDLTQADAIQLYFDDYWQKTRIKDLPSSIAFHVLDAAINHGPRRAIQWLQEIVNVEPDGTLGTKTLKAVRNQADPPWIIQRYTAQRLDFYTQLQTFPTFGRGWIRRVVENLRFAD